MAKKQIPSDGESRSQVKRGRHMGISPLIEALAIGIHRHVEKAVDKAVDNNRKSSDVIILYLIA